MLDSGLDAKHERMRKSPFDFLRATFFRWARTIDSVCPELRRAPRVACVGDAHVENFGTWRDADGRLVWGVNDFDEAAVMPYALDLVRLATSARLAPDVDVRPTQAARAILTGYAKGLAKPRPTLRDQQARWLRPFADPEVRETREFWQDIEECPDASPPQDGARTLRRSLPDGAADIRFAARQSGGGSLGRPRFIAVADWRSGAVVREAKALVPSAWLWARGKSRKRSAFEALARGPYRAPDAMLHVEGMWIVRRLAPDSRKLNIDDVAASAADRGPAVSHGGGHRRGARRRQALEADSGGSGLATVRLASGSRGGRVRAHLEGLQGVLRFRRRLTRDSLRSVRVQRRRDELRLERAHVVVAHELA